MGRLENEQQWRFLLAGISNMCGASGQTTKESLHHLLLLISTMFIYLLIAEGTDFMINQPWMADPREREREWQRRGFSARL